MVMTELPAPGAGIVFGLKLILVPAGPPAADRLMALSNPPMRIVNRSAVEYWPWPTLIDVGPWNANVGPDDPWVTPRYATVVESPVCWLLPITTVNCVPVRVTCWLTLFAGHCAADHIFPRAS